jgi:predicted RNase H-like HicB family nuclease
LTSFGGCDVTSGRSDSAAIRVEFTYDPESNNWCFVVPSLGIVGGAETRDAAEQQVMEAITFTLESENDAEASADSDIRYLRVSVTR